MRYCYSKIAKIAQRVSGSWGLCPQPPFPGGWRLRVHISNGLWRLPPYNGVTGDSILCISFYTNRKILKSKW